MPRLGIVDLGSNTARLVVFAFEPGKWFRLVDQIREPVRLGEGLGNNGRLTRAAQLRARTTLELFSGHASSTGVSGLEVLGTSALRDATNEDEFLDQIRPLELEVSVLSGKQEARLGVLAVANGFSHREQALMALLVRYHLRGKPRLGAYEPLCGPAGQRLLNTLAACGGALYRKSWLVIGPGQGLRRRAYTALRITDGVGDVE